VLLVYGRFLRLYDRMEPLLESELDHAYGRWLGPALMVFHVQLTLRKWYMQQLDVQERNQIARPEFCQGLRMLKVQNNLMWLPTVKNVPSLLVLRATAQVSAPSGATSVTRSNLVGNAAAVLTTTSGAPRRDAGTSVRNPSRDPRYVGTTPFACLVKSRTASQAIAKAGFDPPPPEWRGTESV
jgi:hypothetical protein